MNGKVSGNVNWLMELRAESQPQCMRPSMVCAYVRRRCHSSFTSLKRRLDVGMFFRVHIVLAAYLWCFWYARLLCRTLFLSLLREHSNWFYVIFFCHFVSKPVHSVQFFFLFFVSLVVVCILKSFLNSNSFLSLSQRRHSWCWCEWSTAFDSSD